MDKLLWKSSSKEMDTTIASVFYENSISFNNGIELEAVGFQFEPYWGLLCGVTWDSSRTVVVIKLLWTSALVSLNTNPVDAAASFLIAAYQGQPATWLERYKKWEWEMHTRQLPWEWQNGKFCSPLQHKSSGGNLPTWQESYMHTYMYVSYMYWRSIFVQISVKGNDFTFILLLCCLNTARVVWNIFYWHFSSIPCFAVQVCTSLHQACPFSWMMKLNLSAF